MSFFNFLRRHLLDHFFLTDGRIRVAANGAQHVPHVGAHQIRGGDAATKEPWRMAVSCLVAAFGADLPKLAFLDQIDAAGLKLLLQMIEKRLNSPLTSSVGRLFDAVAALVGVRNRVSYEGQAALELEMLIDSHGDGEPGYPFGLVATDAVLQIDPLPMIRQLVEDMQSGVAPARISARFHNGLAQLIVDVCRQLSTGSERLPVALSGGVFQNRYLTERCAKLLRAAGYDVLLHRQVPPNDGGLALGQAAVAARQGVTLGEECEDDHSQSQQRNQ